MDKVVIDLQVNKGICEAYGCFETATTKINVGIGQMGSISLDLCTNCVKKFYNDNIYRCPDRKQDTVSGRGND